MKKAVTIFLLALLVSAQTPLGQLFKLPLLVEHYIKHQKRDAVSFIGFVAEHYGSDHRDADQREDEQLPFKSLTVNAAGFAIVPAFIKATCMVIAPGDKKVLFRDNYAPQQHVARIFHPPRV